MFSIYKGNGMKRRRMALFRHREFCMASHVCERYAGGGFFGKKGEESAEETRNKKALHAP